MPGRRKAPITKPDPLRNSLCATSEFHGVIEGPWLHHPAASLWIERVRAATRTLRVHIDVDIQAEWYNVSHTWLEAGLSERWLSWSLCLRGSRWVQLWQWGLHLGTAQATDCPSSESLARLNSCCSGSRSPAWHLLVSSQQSMPGLFLLSDQLSCL